MRSATAIITLDLTNSIQSDEFWQGYFDSLSKRIGISSTIQFTSSTFSQLDVDEVIISLANKKAP